MPRHPELKDIPPAGSRRFEEKYPKVTEWLDGTVWELRPGQEFKTKTEGFYQGLKAYLERANISAEVGQRGKSVWIKAAKGTKTTRPKASTRPKRKATKKRRT